MHRYEASVRGTTFLVKLRTERKYELGKPMAKGLVIGASRGIGLETMKAAILAGHLARCAELARSRYG
jgi:hypothetical protein